MDADIEAAADRGEATAMMDPLQVGETSPLRGPLTELAVELAAKSAGFRRSMPEGVVAALADLVRAMNCYFSNLIEGHHTHPVDIERAMRNDYSDDPRKRNLQLEARAHVTVQKWIDEGALAGRAATQAGVCEIHKRFSELLPPEFLSVEDSRSGERLQLEPGVLRKRDVRVGEHVAISPGALPRFRELRSIPVESGRLRAGWLVRKTSTRTTSLHATSRGVVISMVGVTAAKGRWLISHASFCRRVSIR